MHLSFYRVSLFLVISLVLSSVSFSQTWNTSPVTVATGGSTGRLSSLQVVNGNPAMAYYDATNTNVVYVRASNSLGTAWGTPVAIDVSTDNVGNSCIQLLVVNGRPAIAYYDVTNTNLKYIRASDASGTAWGTPVVVDGASTSVGSYLSMAIINGNPAISYYDATNTNPKYVRASDVSGTSWGTPVDLDVSTAATGFSTCLIEDGSGLPCIAYYGNAVAAGTTNYYVYFTRALDVSGANWESPSRWDPSSTPFYVSTPANMANSALSMKLLNAANNQIGIAYSIGGLNAYSLAFRENINSGTTTIESGLADHMNLQMVNGKVGLVYYKASSTSIYYRECANISSSSYSFGAATTLVDATSGSKALPSLIGFGTEAAVSYYQASPAQPMFLSTTNFSGASIATSGLSSSSYCGGAPVSVVVTPKGTFNDGNIFTAQLSDASGSFSSPVTLGTLAGTGSGTIDITLAAAATGTGYRVRVIGSSPATTGTDNGTNLTITKPSTYAASATATVSGNVNSGSLYYTTSCMGIARLVQAGAHPITGNVSAKVYVDATVPYAAGTPYLPRRYDLTANSGGTSSTATITLYYLQSEFDAYNIAQTNDLLDLPANGTDAAELAKRSRFRISQYHGSSATGLPGSYTATGYSTAALVIDPVDTDIVWNASAGRWEVTFAITGFSGFFGYGSNNSIVLPVQLTFFASKRENGINRLSWNTAIETNNRGFTIERSDDGTNFHAVGFVASKAFQGNSTGSLDYFFDDAATATRSYYRLVQTDFDSRSKTSAVVVIKGEGGDGFSVHALYPNPAARRMSLTLESARAARVWITITDMYGRLVHTGQRTVGAGVQSMELDVQSLANGTYNIRVSNADGAAVALNFVKQE